VWLGWRKPSRLYLGQGLVLAAPAGAAAQAIPVAGADLAAALQTATPCFKRGARLLIDLGAHLCMAVPVNYPQGLRGFAERQQVAQAVCAGALGVPMEQVCCEIDPLRPDVAAAALAADITALREWATANGLRVQSIRPLWSVLGDHARLAPSSALVVAEPGGTTVLGQQRASGGWTGFSLAHAASPSGDPVWMEMLDSAHLASNGCRVFRLSDTASAQIMKPSLPWPAYLQVGA
jgi:hypothetical protein